MNRSRKELIGVIAVAVLLGTGLLFGQERPGEAPNNSAATNGPPRTVMVNGVAEPVYRGGKGMTPPQAIYSPKPEYSKEAMKLHIEGPVTLSLIVTSAGETAEIRVKNSLGHGLDEKAIEGVSHWKFAPATKDGKPVSVEIALVIDFHLYQRP